MRFDEVSPDTFQGSLTKDLLLSKTWLLSILSKISKEYSTVYILGSWYGQLSLMLIADGFDTNKIINVDIDRKTLAQGQKMARALRVDDRIVLMNHDANKLDYRRLDKEGLVINTSCNDIKGDNWFNQIPKGTLVALQGRNNAPAKIQYDSLEDFKDRYPLSKVLYQDQITLEDPETEYQRYMVIGLK